MENEKQQTDENLIHVLTNSLKNCVTCDIFKSIFAN